MVLFLKTSCKRVALLTLSCVLLSIGLLGLPQHTPIAHAANGFDMYVWTSLNEVWGHNGSDPGVLIDSGYSTSLGNLTAMFGPITSVIARGSDVWEQRGHFLFQLGIDGGWCNGFFLTTGTCMQELDDNPATTLVVAGGNGQLYQLHSTGSLWQYDGGGFHSWTALDWNSQNVTMVANANKLFLYRSDGTVWKYLGSPLNWLEIDDRSPSPMSLTGLTLSGDGTLFEMWQQFDSLGQTNGAVWVGLGPLNWQLIDLGHLTDDILASNTRVYQLREDRSLLIYDGNFGWIKVDSGISGSIATGTHSDAIYKQLADNSIWEKGPQDSQYTLVSPPVSGQFVEMSSSTNG